MVDQRGTCVDVALRQGGGVCRGSGWAVRACLTLILVWMGLMLMAPVAEAQGPPVGPGMCPPGEMDVGGVCMPITCGPGEMLVGGVCLPITCGPNETLVGGVCMPTTTVPDAPTNVQFDTFTLNPDSVIASWSVPANDGGSPVTTYQYSLYNNATCSSTIVANGTASTQTPDLGSILRNSINANGTTDVSFNVRALNANGSSAPSTCITMSVNAVAPATVPDPPTNVQFQTFTVSPDSLIFSWDIPANDGGSPILKFPFNIYNDATCTQSFAGGVFSPGTTTQSFDLGSQLPGARGRGATAISFDISAQNAVGDSARSTCISMPFDAVAPTLTSVTIASNNANPALTTESNQVTVSVTSDEALATPPVIMIDGSTVTTTGSGTSFSGTKFGFSSIGTDGVLSFSVSGYQDAAGNTGSTVMTTTDMSSVTIDRVHPTYASITRQGHTTPVTGPTSLTWRVTYSENVMSSTAADYSVSGTTATVTNVTAAGTNAFDVTISGGNLAMLDGTVTLGITVNQAVTDLAGNKTQSPAISGTNDGSTVVVAPLTVPDPPTNVQFDTFTLNPDSVIASWSAPANDGGSPITTYQYGLHTDANCTSFISGATGSATQTSDLGTVLRAAILNANATEVSFNVTANNAVGSSAPSTCISMSFDAVAPMLTTVSIASNNSTNTNAARTGDVITVSITADEALQSAPTVTIAGQAAAVTGSGTSWSATLTVAGSTPEGAAAISITNYQDTAGNAGASVSNVTDGSSVTVDNTAPQLTTVTMTSDNAIQASSAGIGKIITVTIVSNEALQGPPMVSIAGQTAAVTGAGTNWSGALTVSNSTPEGAAAISVGGYQDAAGNDGSVITALTSGSAVTVDITAQTIQGIFRNNPVTETTSADSLEFLVIYPEGAFNINNNAFTVTGSSTATVTSVAAEGGNVARLLVTVSGGDLASFDGVVGIAPVTTGANAITDRAGNIAQPPASASTYTLANLPTVPLNVRLSSATTSSVNIIWDEPTSAGGAPLNGYQASYYSDGACNTLVTGGNPGLTRQFTVGSLTQGQTISFDVSAQNSIGQSPRSACQTFSALSDGTAPSLTTVSISSNNATTTVAKVGDVITLSLTSNEALQAAPMVTIAGQTAAVTGSGTSWSATLTVAGSTPEGAAAISITNYQDVAGNMGTTVTATTDVSAVTVDRTAPTLAINTPIPSLGNDPTPNVLIDYLTDGATTAALTGVGCETADELRVSPGTHTFTLGPFADGTFSCSLRIGDQAGNMSTPLSIPAFTIETVAPQVASIVRQNPTTQNTDADTLTWTVDFGEAVQNVDVTDFVVAGTTATVMTALPCRGAAPNTAYDVTISGGDLADLNGTVTLGFAGAQDITDAAGNALNTTPLGANDNTFILQNQTDFTRPSLSIADVPATISEPFTASFTFSESVAGFTIADVNVANGSVSAFTGGGANYSALITPTVAGTVTISVPNGAAFDAAGNASLAASANTEFDAAAPQLVSITRSNPTTETTDADSLSWAISFDENVTGVSVSSFSVSGTTGTVSVSGGGASYTVSVAGGDLADLNGTVTLGVSAAGIADETGNALESATPTGQNENSFVVINDEQAPQLVSITRSNPTTETTDADSLSWAISFDENVTGVSVSSFSVSGTTGTVSVSGGGASYTVSVVGGDLADLNGTVTLGVSASGIADEAGNALESTTPTGQNENSFEVVNDEQAPQLVSITRSNPVTETTDASILTWQIRFDEDVEGVDISDFSVSGTTGTLSVSAVSGALYNVTAAGGDLGSINGTVTLAVSAAQNITNLSGNALESVTPSGANDNSYQVEVDTTPPTGRIEGVPDEVDGPFTVTVMFDEPVIGFGLDNVEVTGGTASNLQTVGKTSLAKRQNSRAKTAQSPTDNTVPASEFSVVITPSGQSVVTIRVEPNPEEAGATPIQDVVGNMPPAVIIASTDSEPPTIMFGNIPQGEIEDAFTLAIAFSEAVTGFTVDDINTSNAMLSDFESLDALTYIVRVSAQSMGLVELSIPADVAEDAGGNGNLASDILSLNFLNRDAIRIRTEGVAHNFMARRADQLLAADPDLTRRLPAHSQSSASASGFTGRVNGSADLDRVNLSFDGGASGDALKLHKLFGADHAGRVSTWIKATLAQVDEENGSESDQFFLHAGFDYALNDNTLIGFMGQYDDVDQERAPTQADADGFSVSGTGFLVGPYVVAKLKDTLTFDGRVAWGESMNEISPFNSYTDEFETTRWLFKAQLTGQASLSDWSLNPEAALFYYTEESEAYTDSNGVQIGEQDISLGRLSFGPRLSKTFRMGEGTDGRLATTLRPELSIRGLWDFETAGQADLTTGLITGSGSFRARTEGGLTFTLGGTTTLTLDAFYDGIGTSTFNAYGASLRVDITY